MGRVIITRAEALAASLPNYFTGKPCVNGHIAERRTRLRHCRMCLSEKAKRRRLNNPEQHSQSCKAWKAKNKDRADAYRKTNKDRERLCDRLRYRKNIEAERMKALERKRANPVQARVNNAMRRARRRGNGGKHTASDIINLLQKQGYCCKCCGADIASKYHIDHIMPVALGGTNDIENIQLLCPPCNMSKGSLHPAVWEARIASERLQGLR